MTFTYALIAAEGIVLAADSEVTFSQNVTNDYFGPDYVAATYRSKKHKIQILKNGVAFSIAGNEGLVDLLLKEAKLKPIGEDQSYQAVVGEYGKLFQEIYLDRYENDRGSAPHCTFQFCGYLGGECPLIYKLCSMQAFSPRPQGNIFGFTGRENHGAALYLHHRLASEGMPLNLAKQLVYCVLTEVADLDNMVNRPIEMVVISRAGTTEVDPSEFERYEEIRQKILPALRGAFFPAETKAMHK